MPHPLDVFIPIDRRFALHNNISLPEHSAGTALFADISGFTPITEALVEELGAHRAVEELTYQLNQVYNALIAQVHRYGGAVIGFVGDAITCWFDSALLTAPSTSPKNSEQRAVTCALAMQMAMQNFKAISLPTGKTVPLYIKIGIASGPAKRFVVGDPSIQLIDTMAGTTLQRTALAEKQATNNEILIDETTKLALEDSLNIAELRLEPKSQHTFAVVTHFKNPAAPTPWPAIPPLSKIRPWLLKPVYKEANLNQRELLPDLRPAVSLFLRFAGLDYDQDNHARKKLDAYIQWVQQTVDKDNGLLIQLTIGDRGSFLYVAFGADVAHEDDAARAITAAQQLINPPPKLKFIKTTQIGLARGQARVGPYGSMAQRSYGVIGDDAILAHRLMMATKPGEVLCDYNIYRATNNDWLFEVLQPIYVKGKTNPVKIFKPLNKRTTFKTQQEIATAHVDLIGRETELYILNMLLDRVQEGANRILIIEGPAGIGKSHLVSEFNRLAQARGLSTLMGHGLSSENQMPYQVWRDIFNLYFGIDSITDLNKRQEWITTQITQLAPQLTNRLPLLNDILGLGLPENDLTRPMDPALRHQSLVAMLLDLLRTWVEGTSPIIILEDATWLDTVSWDLALQIARRFAATQTPLLMIILVRPLTTSPDTKTYLQIDNLPQTNHIQLAPLSAHETTLLAANRLALSPQDLPENISRFLYKQTEGNPFYIEELILALKERKLITIEAKTDSPAFTNQCLVKDNFEQALTVLPDTIQGLILSRIDRLKPEQQWLLKVAAVIGRSFSYSVLSHVLKRHPNYTYVDLRTSIEALIFLDFFRLESTDPEPTFSFQQLITHEVAYQTLLYAQRRDLHLTVARWFESRLNKTSVWQPDFDLMQVLRQPVAISPYLPLLMYHFHHAEKYEQERYYAILAGKQAAIEFANVEAIRYYSRALELVSTQHLELRFELLLLRETLYDLQASREAQFADLIALQEMVDALPTENFGLSTARKGQIMLRQANYYEATGDYQMALHMAEQVIKFALQHKDPVTQCEGYITHSIALWRQGNYQTAHKIQKKALKLAQKLNNQALTAKSFHYLALTYAYQENYHQAGKYYQRAIDIYQETGDIQGQARSLLNSARLHYAQGNYQATQEISTRALNVCKPIGDRRSEAIILGNLGIVYGDLGLYQRAHEYLEKALVLSIEMVNPQLQSANLGALGTIYRLTGEYAKSIETCQEAIVINQTIGDRYGEGFALTNLAHTLMELDDFETAKEIYNQALTLRNELGQHNSAIDDKAGLARVALAQNNLSEGLAHVKNILNWIEAHGTEGIDEPIWVYLTCYHILKTQNITLARLALEKAHLVLQTQLSQIINPEFKKAFLENVKINQELLTIWQELQ